jgi:hypothetical protein
VKIANIDEILSVHFVTLEIDTVAAAGMDRHFDRSIVDLMRMTGER